MSGTLKVGGKTLATHDTNTNVAKIQLGSTSDVVFTDSTGNNVLSESGGVVTLTADEANVGSNALVVDSSGYVGIGTSSPDSKIHSVSTTAGANSVNFQNTDSGGYGAKFIGGGGASNLYIVDFRDYSGSSKLKINGSGNIEVSNSINTSSPLTVANPSAGTSGFGCIQTSLNSNASGTGTHHIKMTTQNVASFYIYGNGTTAFGSDERLKKNIETTRDGYIEDIKNLRVVKYHWNDQDDSTPKELGLIAQEVEQVFPGLIQEHELENVGNDIKHIKVSVIPFILVKAIQEQQALIESQQSQIDVLTARIEALEATT